MGSAPSRSWLPCQATLVFFLPSVFFILGVSAPEGACARIIRSASAVRSLLWPRSSNCWCGAERALPPAHASVAAQASPTRAGGSATLRRARFTVVDPPVALTGAHPAAAASLISARALSFSATNTAAPPARLPARPPVRAARTRICWGSGALWGTVWVLTGTHSRLLPPTRAAQTRTCRGSPRLFGRTSPHRALAALARARTPIGRRCVASVLDGTAAAAAAAAPSFLVQVLPALPVGYAWGLLACYGRQGLPVCLAWSTDPIR
jgi:hypothetical protein